MAFLQNGSEFTER